eukprot:gnl/TRDRNA2_/TRDRNA2_139716_c2_seq5.p2 gnl/TRDRNA2_/TRDRNA2_139716_c2~~gnl/TRDRNA2_/TRDRNA2_139716_c2_seq5.p2  ORF type:complete len:115 (+),score=15.66 gnl/TRDRNA2_/TRDRNA2_139716_c2_seq5:154-498(+)
MMALAMGVLSTVRSGRQLASALGIWIFGFQRSMAVSAYLQKHGQAVGLGQGEIVAAQMNLAALIKMFAPLLYGNLFAWATHGGRNRPGAPYVVVAAMTLLSQATFWSIDPDKVE